MRIARPILLFLSAAFGLAGCGNLAPSNLDAADGNALADLSMDRPTGESQPSHSGRNAAAGDIAPGQEVMLEEQGLGVAVRGLHVGQHYEFGRSRADVVAMLTNLRGPATGSGRNEECGEGPIDFVDFGNLRVNFQNDRFVGWNASPGGRPVRDEWGFGVGSPRGEITENDGATLRVERSTLGVEFESGGFHGLLGSDRPDATVTSLWAGMVCAFR